MPSVSTFVVVFLVVAVSFSLIQVSCQPCTVSAQVLPEASSPANSDGLGGNFSIIWITDTQYLTESYPTYFDSLCRWIVNNADKYNVKMVVHTGDLVEDEGNTSNWDNANRSMSILLDAGIPYCWNAGNHDYNATCWIGNQYTAFNPANFVQQPTG